MSNSPMPATPIGPESEIQELSENAPERKAVEQLLEKAVSEMITELRAPLDLNDHRQRNRKRENALFLKEAMENNNPNNSFLLIEPRRGRLIGAQSCYNAAMSVCAEVDFTIAEAIRIYNETPEADMSKISKNFSIGN